MFVRQVLGCIVIMSGFIPGLASGQSELGERGPNGGHLVDVADRYHLELVAAGQELRLYVSDIKDRKVPVNGASARATVISAGGKSQVELKPAGDNMLKGAGMFATSKTMKVDLVLTLAGASSPVVAKFQPLAALGDQKHEHKGHKH
jgi:hypothetical protein